LLQRFKEFRKFNNSFHKKYEWD